MKREKETLLPETSLQKITRSFNTLFDLITDLGAVLAAILLILMTVMICYSVVMRYYFGMPAGWSNEITEYALLYITFLGATWLLRKDGHVRVDLLVNNLDEPWRIMLNMWTALLSILVCILITYHGTLSTLDHYHRGIPVIKSLSIAKYLLLWVIPAGMFLLLIQFIRDFVVMVGQLFTLIRGKSGKSIRNKQL